jgi:LysM repeat protein
VIPRNPAICVAVAVALIGSAVGAGGASATRSYRVRPGDSLTAIAHTYGTSVGALARLNGLDPAGTLLAGSTLRLPGAEPVLQSYRVRPGDTLTGIAAGFRSSVAAIARMNGLDPAQTLLSGSVLRVPTRAEPHATYTVQPGDSLSSIAIRYGVSLGALADLNRMRIEDVLPIGRKLALPSASLGNTLAGFDRSSVRGSIYYWSQHYAVDPHLVAGLAWMESGFNNAMVSTTGAIGVMQVEPDTWDYVEQVLLLGTTVPHDTDGNVRIGVAYLHHLLNVFGGNERLAVAAYYQGMRAVQEVGFLPGTKRYVDDVLALKERF